MDERRNTPWDEEEDGVSYFLSHQGILWMQIDFRIPQEGEYYLGYGGVSKALSAGYKAFPVMVPISVEDFKL